MKRTYIADTIKNINKEVKILGRAATIRDHGKVTFIDVTDNSGLVQVVTRVGIEISPQDIVEVIGKVIKRAANLVNKDIKTGAIEIEIKSLKILSKSLTSPIPIEGDGRDIDEDLRLKYRYLDLRRPRLKNNLKLRHQMLMFMRQFLTSRGFIEIETPILTKATPEGARDFVVPSRLQPGKFYALPQSPQQYKQLLMVADYEKYFQIARCFRDEDLRADRAYGEFTQLDMEMSYVTQEDILTIIEQLFKEITEKVFKKKVYKYPFPRISHSEAIRKYGADKFDLRIKKSPDVLAFAFVIDFPLFEKTEEQAISPSHHPFTAPKEEDLKLLDKNPMKVRSYQHDLVCNGLEVGGGSIRISDHKIQRKIFRILGYKEKEIEEKFGHLLNAFRYGVPPHGGIAPGIERLLMVATGEENTREVMAYPVTGSGQTAVMDAPSVIEDNILREFKLKKL